MNVRNRALKPVLALLYASAFWGFVWYPLRELELLGLAGAWQALVAYAVALLVLLLARGLHLKGITERPWDVIGLILAIGWANVAFLLAVLQDEVVRVLILFYLSPLWTVLLGRWMLGERIRWLTAWMLVLGMTGAVIMLWGDGALEIAVGLSDFLAVSAGFAFALGNVLTRRLDHLGTVSKTQLGWVGVLLISIVFIAFSDMPIPQVGAIAWLGAGLLGMLGFLFSTLSVVYGVSHMPVQRSSVIMLFEILVGAISAWLLAGEMIDGREWLGGALIIGGGLVAVFGGEKSGK